MRLCVWAGASGLLPFLLLLNTLHVHTTQLQPKERHYYIAAVEIDWKYSGKETHRSGPTYKKVVFREYEKDFRQAKTHPSWLGLLGPTLRAEQGETIVVTFRNMASGAYSIHPHGVAYGKQSEGAHYFDNTSQKEKEDDIVLPNREHVYYWEVTAEVSPQRDDPTCLTYTYISHQNVVEDYNSGLIGTLLICKPGSLDESGQQRGVHHEYVFLFGIFDEKESRYKPNGPASDEHVKYTINGYTKGSLPDVRMCAHASVSLHLVGMSSEAEVFSVHMNGQVLQQSGHQVSSVGLISGSTATASMVALYTGRWLLSSHTTKHIEAGMHGFVNVEKCEGFEAPQRRMTIEQRRQSREWKYFIAAEEVIWDYSPTVHQHVDADFSFQYLKQSPTRIGQKYKKVVYTLYNNESFTERVENKQRKNELGILGPVIRAQIRDVIKVVFKNMASRPYSIYPHGLIMAKSNEGVNYPEGGNQSHGVQPGETHTYVWKVLEEAEPLEGDSRCLTRMYHSAVNTPRDIASGLIGPILICKSQSLNVRNVQLKADKEQHAMFAVFDENKSWYMEDNIRLYTDRTKVNRADVDFYRSNIMHTINGYVFEGGPLLGFCNGEVVTWHVSSIGAQDFIQTATFYGHPFKLNERTEDFLSLYPMTGETITMDMDNIGVWLLASLNTHETTKGVRLKFRDVECYRDYQYEYEETTPIVFNMWNPPTFEDIEKEEKEKEEEISPLKNEKVQVDYYTDFFAAELGLRSRKNQTTDSDVEQLDLSVLDYDTVDVDDGHTNKNKTAILERNALNGTFLSNWTDIDENTTHVDNRSAASSLDNSTVKTENTTVTDVLPKNDSSTNTSVPLVGSNLDNNNVSDTTNSSIHNVTSSSVAGNVSTEVTNITATLEETTNLTLTFPGNVSSPLETERTNATQTGDNQTSVETLSRGDVFSYSVPLPTSSNDHSDVSVITLSQSEEENNTATYVSADTEGASIPADDVEQFNISSSDGYNLTIVGLEVEGTDDKPGDDAAEMDSSENDTFVSLETEPFQNGTVPTEDPDVWRSNASEELRSEVRGNITAPLAEMNQTSSAEPSSNETVVSADLPPSNETLGKGGAEESATSESSEEVLIYLMENNTLVIKTTSVKTHGHNWTYEGTHQMVPNEIPEHMGKYFEKETPQTTAAPKKKTKKVTRRHKPQSGKGMKTKKRKEYKPLARSGLPFSPRGFNPGMTPRGARPSVPQLFSNEEDLINMPVVIGVPRPDFSDYELYIPGEEPDHLIAEEQELDENEYEYVIYKDPYSDDDTKNLNLDDAAKYYLKSSDPNTKTYFIAAEEVQWDYGGYGQRRQDKVLQKSRETMFTKVIFRRYLDPNFNVPDVRGELDEHLGILGPLIKAEVGQSIVVVFKNNGNRPYSIHPNGVSYTKLTEGLSYDDESKYWYKYDNEVQPNSTFTYMWKVNSNVGPSEHESACRTWTYYSGVNPEKDIHSGLIGPLLVCRKGTLTKSPTDVREFMLLFMTFDESQSWYYERNREIIQRKTRRRLLGPKENFKFHSINGITFNLKGLRMYTNQLARWHLINMGSPKDVQSIHFHGQTFLNKKISSYRQAVYPLLPGDFATLEMYPSRPGLWQLETEVGLNQQEGMQTLFLVLDNDCDRPLGLESGSVKNSQITASNTRGSWKPHLARLNNQGQYNAWSTDDSNSYIQVDFQRPVVIGQVATQGAKQMFQSQYVVNYTISYSTDRRRWTFYKGDSTDLRKLFAGNQEAYRTKTNVFFPPVIGRYVRVHPVHWYNRPTLRMEFYGCELDGCSVPLGMESGAIEDHRITASSTASSWYSGPWTPSLARLNRRGNINAWQAKNNNMNQWLQVELPQVKKITGIITQGAKSLGKEMFVESYSLQYSDDGIRWTDYTDEEDFLYKTFSGNKNNNDHVKNYIYPPIFSRFIRIIPRIWTSSITMRIELLGCDFE